jgi:urease accessory protein
MQRAIEHRPASSWPADAAAGSVTLDYDARHRRRIRLTTDGGEDVLLDLAKAVAMAHGDGLLLDDGRWLTVLAAPETLIEVRAGDGLRLARIAWHLGNRHLPTEIGEGVIRLRPDHVIEAMLVQLGADVAQVSAPFQPEGGAYGGDTSHGHAQAHGHDHHGQPHSHDHDHDH